MSDTKTTTHEPMHGAFLSAADLKKLMEAKDQAKAAEEKKQKDQADAARKALVVQV
jgi:hypothetical protein